MVVAVDRHRPGAPDAAWVEGRPRCRASVGLQHRHAAQTRVRQEIVEHDLIGIRHPAGQFELQQFEFRLERESRSHRIGDPGVALAVDSHPLTAMAARGKHFDFARIARQEARHGVANGVGDPNPVLLVNRKVKRAAQLARAVLIRLAVGGLAVERALGRIALGQVHDSVVGEVERPDIASRGSR